MINLNFSFDCNNKDIYFIIDYDGDYRQNLAQLRDLDGNIDTVKDTFIASLKLTKLAYNDSIIDSTQSFISNSAYTGYIDYMGDVIKVIKNEEETFFKKIARRAKVSGKAIGYMAKGLGCFAKTSGLDQSYLNSIVSELKSSGSILSAASFSLKTVTAIQEMHKNGISFKEGVNAIAATSKVYLTLAPLLVANPPMLSIVSAASSVVTIAAAGIKLRDSLSKPKVLTEEEELEKEYHFSKDNPSIDSIIDLV